MPPNKKIIDKYATPSFIRVYSLRISPIKKPMAIPIQNIPYFKPVEKFALPLNTSALIPFSINAILSFLRINK
jgi:hypothetical protein